MSFCRYSLDPHLFQEVARAREREEKDALGEKETRGERLICRVSDADERCSLLYLLTMNCKW